jgi:pilus assembly protein CpaE
VFIGRLRRLTPDLLVIDGQQFRDPFVGAAHEIKSLSPAPAVIAVVAEADAEAVLKAIRAGANECIMPPFGVSLREALERVCRRQAAAELEQPRAGKAIGFLSVKGGCGATSIACHVAAGLHQATEHQILLADFDVNVGMVGYLMKAQTPYSLLDAVKRYSTPDFHRWSELVWKAESRLEVLPSPTGPPSKETPEVLEFREVLRFMQSQYDWVVADLGRGFNHLSRGLLEELDGLFLVSTAEVPALYRAKQMIQSLADGGYDVRRLVLILNRIPKYREFTSKELRDLLGVPVYWELPELPELQRAFVQGRLAPAESRSARQLTALAAKIAGVRPAKIPPGSSSFGLKRLLPGWFGA